SSCRHSSRTCPVYSECRSSPFERRHHEWSISHRDLLQRLPGCCFRSLSFAADVQRPTCNLQFAERLNSQSGIGSKPANISADSDNALSEIQSQTSKNLFHITRTFEFLCAAAIASCDFHSETSIIVPSCARMIIGVRSVTSPSLRNVGTRFLTNSRVSLSLPGLGRYATMTMTGSIIAESQHIPIRDNNNQRPGQVYSVPVEPFRIAH